MKFQEGNPGRPKGSKNRSIPIGKLIDAFELKCQDVHSQSFLEYICDKAFADNKLLTALLKMMIEKQADVIEVYDNNEWADKTPSEIADEMDNLTSGDNNG